MVDEKLFVFEETNHAYKYNLLVQKQNSKAKNIRLYNNIK